MLSVPKNQKMLQNGGRLLKVILSLRIFSLHKCIFDKETKNFIHFLVVIGYSGGGCQEECFYKINGSNFEKSTIQISTSAGDSFYQFSFKNQC